MKRWPSCTSPWKVNWPAVCPPAFPTVPVWERGLLKRYLTRSTLCLCAHFRRSSHHHLLINLVVVSLSSYVRNIIHCLVTIHHNLHPQLLSLGLQVGYPEQVLASSYLDDYYTAMSVQVNDFLGNILYGVHFLRKTEERMLLNPLPEHRWLRALSADSITYIPEANRIVLPEHLLLPPFYNVHYPA